MPRRSALAPAAAIAAVDQPAACALAEAADRLGYDLAGHTVLQHAGNWVVRLPNALGPGAPVIAKVHRAGTGLEEVARQARIAFWLLEHDVLTARPLHGGRPVLVAGRPVTVLEDLGNGGPCTVVELAQLAARLHALPVADHLVLPPLDPAHGLLARIAALPGTVLTDADRAWLGERTMAFDALWQAAEWAGPEVIVHGDLHLLNTLSTPLGPAVLDFEFTRRGVLWYDLAFKAGGRDLFGQDPALYAAFARTYGVDVTAVDGGRPYALMIQVRALFGVVVALEEAVRNAVWLPEARRRIASVRRPGPYPWNWSSPAAPRGARRPGTEAAE
ncbi:phosphotransferase enzyme family protein [Kitasatospora sp. NPDC001664]